ncbi:hypothetical protein K431DRAFT_286679 [Polychaeton citri CBS 116435]|uniref:Uncharacterized protein n=1 Tax=Polychaeton citri CBS 116435 TaxID=1314669 RepID=A0A9P4Q2V0_9PEZI|nr:hypothetical protein K431DRAFT_286679 [Polychaeton citri CBS 116435]
MENKATTAICGCFAQRSARSSTSLRNSARTSHSTSDDNNHGVKLRDEMIPGHLDEVTSLRRNRKPPRQL